MNGILVLLPAYGLYRFRLSNRMSEVNFSWFIRVGFVYARISFLFRTYIILQRLWWKNKYKIFGKIFGSYVVKHYFCTRIRERTAHQHDERGNLWKGDEVRDSKQDSNRRSDSKKLWIFLLKNLPVKIKSLPLQPQSKDERKFFERFTYQQVVQVLKINTVKNLKIN